MSKSSVGKNGVDENGNFDAKINNNFFSSFYINTKRLSYGPHQEQIIYRWQQLKVKPIFIPVVYMYDFM